MIITTQEWGSVPDGYDYLEPNRSSVSCIVIKTEIGDYLALYWVRRDYDTGKEAERVLARREEFR